MYDAALCPCNLTISQFSLLTVLEHYGRLKVAELTEVMVMERTSLVRALKPMLDGGLIQSSAQVGERAKVLSLTEARHREAGGGLSLLGEGPDHI